MKTTFCRCCAHVSAWVLSAARKTASSFGILLLASGSLHAAELVGAIPGSFDVSSTGAGTYRIPVDIPSATGGMRPNLSLIYNHRNGKGIAGMGWTISGLSRISRCPKTLAQDSQIQGVRYQSSDRFCLDGQRLVLVSGTYGATGSEYRTEIDRFKKITIDSVETTGSPRSFTVRDPDGTVHRYGFYEQSSMYIGSGFTARSWGLYRSEDRFGNQVNYFYQVDRSIGEWILDKIEFTANPAQSLTARYRVLFDYVDRPASDQRFGFESGAIWSRYRALRSIDVQHLDTSWTSIDKYDLGYSTAPSGRYRLDSVTRCAGSDCFPATVIDWKDSVPGWNALQTTTQTSSGHSNPLVGDFDGDGQDDLFVVKSGRWHVLRASSNGEFSAPLDSGLPAPNAQYSSTLDIDGDGKDDLLVPGSDSKWHVYRSDGSAFSDINTTVPIELMEAAFAQDIDGDGLDDLLYIDDNQDSIRLRKSTGLGFSASATVVLNSDHLISFVTGSNDPKQNPLDFDGDKLGDIIVQLFEPEEQECEEEEEEECDESGDENGIDLWSAWRFDGTEFKKYADLDTGHSPLAEDINGDGLTDILYYDSAWRFRISDGNGFQAVNSSGIADSYPEKAVFADYDADGRKDLIRASTSTWIVHPSNGNGFDATGVSLGGPSPASVSMIAMDITGSGQEELVMSSSGSWRSRVHKSTIVDVVEKVTDGLGNYFEPTYESIAISSHYAQIYLGAPPTNRSYQEPLYVVTDLRANDGSGGSFTKTYTYYGAKMDLRGRGFLGFYQTRAYDPRNGSTLYRRFYNQSFPYIGRLELEQVRQSSDWAFIQSTDPVWESSQTYPGAYFVRKNYTTRVEYDVAGLLEGQEVRRVVDNPSYDPTYGNVTQRIITTTSPQSPGDTFTTTVSFQLANYTSSWCLGLPTLYSVTRSAPGATTRTRTMRNTFNASNCRVLTSTDESESSTALRLKTTFTYDAFGNLKTATQDSANGAADDRKTEIFYDQWGHLPERTRIYVDNAADAEFNQSWDYGRLLPLSRSDIQSQLTTYAYDPMGRMASITRPDGTTSSIAFSNCVDCWVTGRGRFRTTLTESDGMVALITYDRYSRPIGTQRTQRGGTASRTTTLYDARGRVYRQYGPWVFGETAYKTDFAYDIANRITQINAPISESQPTGAITAYSYEGLRTSVTNAEGQVTTQFLDPLGRVTSVVDAMSGTTRYDYTVFDEIAKIWDPANQATTFSYNNRGDLQSVSDPNNGVRTNAFNVFGELVSQTDSKSQTVTYSYNQLGLLKTRNELEGLTTWNYYQNTDHRLWQLSSVVSPNGYSESYSYDTFARPTKVTTTIDGTGYDIDLAYHSSGSGRGKLKRLTYPTSTSGYRFKVDYVYDAWGELQKVVNGDSPSLAYHEVQEVDAFGRHRLATLGNGVDVSHDYDRAAGYLNTIQAGVGLGTSVQHLEYEWNKIGYLEEQQDVNGGNTEVFSYDALNRLKSASLNGSTSVSLNYDNVGNITYKSDVGTYAYGAGTAGPNAVTGITGLRGATYSYDLNGNMNLRNGDPITWFSFDKPDRINRGADYSEFEYGPSRNRFKQVASDGGIMSTILYVGGLFEKETSPSGTEYRHHIQAGGGTAAIYTRSTGSTPTVMYLHRDQLGSVVATSDQSGGVLERYSFDAFGKRRNVDWTADNSDLLFDASQLTERGYTGHEHLDNVQLVHMNGRVQDPIIGRMISADPFIPDPLNSQYLNRYSYVRNSPLSIVDPSGFYGDDVDHDLDDWDHWADYRFGRGTEDEDGEEYANIVVEPMPTPDAPKSRLGWAGFVLDFVPIIGDIKGIKEAYDDPTFVNITAAVVGLTGPWGDAFGKALKTADNVADATKAARAADDVPTPNAGSSVPTGNGGPPDTGVYHRLESPTQTPQDAARIQESGELMGRAPRGSSIPTVQAYDGPLPDGARGIEFTTDAQGSVHPRSGEVRFRPGDKGVELRESVTLQSGDVDDVAVIRCVVTRNTQC